MREHLKHKPKRKLSQKKSSEFDLGPIPIENIVPATRGKFDYDNIIPKSILKNNVNNQEEANNKKVRFSSNVEEFPSMDFNEAGYVSYI